MKRSRWLLLILLFSSTLFFRGCQNSKYFVTTGPVAPYATIELADHEMFSIGNFDYNVLLPARIIDFSLLLLLVNLLGFTLIVIGVLCYGRFLNGLLGSLLFASLWTVFALFQAVVYLPIVWSLGVLSPTSTVCGWIRWALANIGIHLEQQTYVDIASRVYFGLLVVALTVAMLSIHFLATRRFVRRIWKRPD